MKDQTMNRRQLSVLTAVAALILTTGAIVAVLSVNQKPRPAACADGCAATDAPAPTEPAVIETEPALDDEDATPSGPWTPCDADSCVDLTEDACDGAYDASRDGKGELLDALIENKDLIDGKRFADCPQFLSSWKEAQAGFSEGDEEVGVDVKAGTYETTSYLSGGRVSECYWERSGKNGRTIANDFVTAAKKIRITIHKSDEMFTSQGCGDWMRVS